MKFFKTILHYLAHHRLITAVGLYFLVTVLIKSYTGLDYTIPCIFRTFLGFKCLGCGLTTACTHLAQGDTHSAYEANWLIFIVAPAGLFYLIKDFRRFSQNPN